MIDQRRTEEILAQYKKHGWNLRRVLLSAPVQEKLLASLFGGVKIISSELDAVWFSRASSEGREAWELRSLSTAPFALVEIFEEDDEEDVREEARSEMEARLIEQLLNIGNRKPVV